MTSVLDAFRRPATYSAIALVTACLYLYLFASLALSPDRFLSGVGLASNDVAEFLARRASMLMLGFAVVALQAVRARQLAARQLAALAIAINMAGFAVMSFHEYTRGFASSAILAPAVVETTLATLFLLLWLANLRAAQNETTRNAH